MARDPFDRPMVKIELALPDGTKLEKDFSYRQMENGEFPQLKVLQEEGPPEWWTEPSRVWDRPQDPITFRGKVAAGHEAEAREFLGVDPPG